jgi:hypothetical protein
MKKVGFAMIKRSSAICAVAITNIACGGANAAESVEEMIRDALAAAPPSIGSTATIKDWDNRIAARGRTLCLLPNASERSTEGTRADVLGRNMVGVARRLDER